MAESIQLSPLVREIFTKYGTRRRYHAGEVLEQKGDAALQAGYLEISLVYLGPGELFGSAALLSRSPVMVSLSAVTDAEACLLPADRFWARWAEAGGTPQDLLTHFVRRIAMLSDYLCCAHFTEDDKRVAYFLHTCCAASGPVIPYTHEQIAAVTGMSRISVTRILRRFREAGILRQAYRRIEVLQPHRLLEVFGSLGYFLD